MKRAVTGCYLYSEVNKTMVSVTIVICSQSASLRDYFITWRVKYSTFLKRKLFLRNHNGHKKY